MRASKVFLCTRKETPKDAEATSHALLIRGGFVSQVSSGIYAFSPHGYKVIYKITDIVRKEMYNAGAQEILLPIIRPSELWQETGRWNLYGNEMFRLKDREERMFCLGPTHEEVITKMVEESVNSYAQIKTSMDTLWDRTVERYWNEYKQLEIDDFIKKFKRYLNFSDETKKFIHDKYFDSIRRVMVISK